MKLSRLMAAKCGWSISSKASARVHWSGARARARRERRNGLFAGKPGAAGLAQAGLGNGGGHLRDIDRARAPLVDVAGGYFRALLARDGGMDSRLQGLLPVAEAPDMLSADCTFFA